MKDKFRNFGYQSKKHLRGAVVAVTGAVLTVPALAFDTTTPLADIAAAKTSGEGIALAMLGVAILLGVIGMVKGKSAK